MSITSNKTFKKPYAPLLPDVVHAPFPYPFREGRSPEESVDRALEEVRAIVEEPYGGLTDPAGIFVEPIQGRAASSSRRRGSSRGCARSPTKTTSRSSSTRSRSGWDAPASGGRRTTTT